MVGGGPHNSMTMPISDKSVLKMPKTVTPLMVSIILGRPAGHSKLGRTAGGGPPTAAEQRLDLSAADIIEVRIKCIKICGQFP